MTLQQSSSQHTPSASLTATWVTGNTLDVLAAIPDGSIDLAFTSWPFLALRSYLPADDPAKRHEIGSEPSPGAFIDRLLDVTEALRRVLAPHGSFVSELGDTYAGSGGAGGDYLEGGLRDGQEAFSGSATRQRRGDAAPKSSGQRTHHDGNGKPFRGGDRQPDHTGDEWPAPKSLCLVPELFRIALVYGFNPLTGRTTPRWRARNVIRWARPNPPVGALSDKMRPATSELVVACGTDEAGRHRYFDLDAVRYPSDYRRPSLSGHGSRASEVPGQPRNRSDHKTNPRGAPPLDWWTPTDLEQELWDQWIEDLWEIPTHGYKGAHYATWPPALCERPIKAMCPLKVCTVCGQPSRRLTSTRQVPNRSTNGTKQRGAGTMTENFSQRTDAHVETIGWSCCGHGHGCTPTQWSIAMLPVQQGLGPDREWYDLDNWPHDLAPTATRTRKKRRRVLDTPGACADGHWRRGRVLDPFAGSGTTGMVATGHGRNFIGIELDQRNEALAQKRIGMFFEKLEAADLAERLQPENPTC
jgi:DNA modification methylase